MSYDELSPEGEAERGRLQDALEQHRAQLTAIEGVAHVYVAGIPEYVGIEVEFSDRHLRDEHYVEIEELFDGLQVVCRVAEPPPQKHPDL